MLVKFLILGLVGVSYARPRFECPPSGHVLLPHQTDCSKFYLCNDGERSEEAKSCGGDLRFSYQRQECDHPEKVQCVYSEAVETAGVEAAARTYCKNGKCGIPEFLENGCPSNFSIHFLLPHETDCTKYYQCNFGAKILRPCAPGTHFNKRIQVCDHPKDAGCETGNGCDDNNGILPNGCPTDFNKKLLLPHESDCALYYECVRGEKVQKCCGNGLHFNPTSQVCDNPKDAGCETGNECDDNNGTLPNGCPADFNKKLLLPHESDCALYYECVRGEKVQKCCGNGLHFNPTLQICDVPANAGCDPGCDNGTLPNGCPSDFNIHLLLPHEDNCELFYQCVHGKKVLRQCAPGTHFNPTLQVCDHPKDAGCETGNGCDDNNGTLPNGCPADFNKKLLLPHESDCALYYECVRGEKVQKCCGNGLHFNPTLQICDLPANAGCDPGCDNGTLPNGCPSDFNIHLLLPHEDNCELFYHCVHGKKVLRQCAPGTHFNPTLQVCDHPANAGCDPNCGGGNNGCQEDNRCKDNCHVPFWRHDLDCDKFWRCVDNQPVLGVCTNGLLFNENTQTCDFQCNVKCVRRNIKMVAEMDGFQIFLPWNQVDSFLEHPNDNILTSLDISHEIVN